MNVLLGGDFAAELAERLAEGLASCRIEEPETAQTQERQEFSIGAQANKRVGGGCLTSLHLAH